MRVMNSENEHWDKVDWAKLVRRFHSAQADIIHAPGGMQVFGAELEAEAMRRAIEGQTLRLSSDKDRGDVGLVPAGMAEARVELQLWSANAERDRATARYQEVINEYCSEKAVLARELAAAVRDANNERRVPSRFRREGVEIAAGWLDSAAVYNDAHGTAKVATDDAIGPAPTVNSTESYYAHKRFEERRHVAYNAAIRALADYDRQNLAESGAGEVAS
jgi:hypothetical protein